MKIKRFLSLFSALATGFLMLASVQPSLALKIGLPNLLFVPRIFWVIVLAGLVIVAVCAKCLLSVACWAFLLLSLWAVPTTSGASVFKKAGKSTTLRVVTINCQSYEADIEAVSDKLRGLNPDIVLLQEVWRQHHVESLLCRLPGFRSYGTFPEKPEDFLPGVAVFAQDSVLGLFQPESSRWVLAKVSLNDSPPLTVGSYHGAKAKIGAAAVSSPTVARRTIDLQKAQLAQVVEREPDLVAGDFNALPEALWEIEAMSNYQVATPPRPTYPATFPVMSLDRVYFNPRRLGLAGVWTEDLGCDHLAVICDFRIIK